MFFSTKNITSFHAAYETNSQIISKGFSIKVRSTENEFLKTF